MTQGNPPSRNDGSARADGGGRERTRRFAVAVGIVVAIALVGAIIFLHASGSIGPGSH